LQWTDIQSTRHTFYEHYKQFIYSVNITSNTSHKQIIINRHRILRPINPVKSTFPAYQRHDTDCYIRNNNIVVVNVNQAAQKVKVFYDYYRNY